MGCEFICDALPIEKFPTSNDVQQELENLIKQAEWDHGHSGYTGSLAEANGIDIRSRKKFRSFEEAAEWLDDNAPKFGSVVVVKTDEDWVYGANCSS